MIDGDYHILLGKRIKKLRDERKLSQTEFADLCDIERGNMSRLENGKVEVKRSTLVKIAKALDMKVWELIPF